MQIMLDIETLGRRADAKITQISFVTFDNMGPISKFNYILNLDEQEQRTVSESTLKWYKENNIPLEKEGKASDVKEMFSVLISEIEKSDTIWFNRPNDYAWLKSLYEENYEDELPLDIRKFNDMSVLVDIYKKGSKKNCTELYTMWEKQKTHFNAHNAIEDCVMQIETLKFLQKNIKV